MLSVACPSCGAPAPVSLATPDVIACDACHHRGPPGPELSRELHAAAGQAAYFGIVTSGRGGVAAVVPGAKDPTGARHYGIDTREPKAFAVDGGQVFWVDGSSLSSEPVVPP